MSQVNNVLNRIDAYNDQNVGFFKREIQSRATNLFVTTPLELSEIVKNTILTPVRAAGAALKTVTKATAFVTGSETVRKFEEKLPGFNDLLRTISNVFKYAIGAFLSATVGVLFPNVNYKLQCGLGVAVHPRYQEIRVEISDYELTPEDQELLDSLNQAFAMAKQIEEEARLTIQEAVETIQDTSENGFSITETQIYAN